MLHRVKSSNQCLTKAGLLQGLWPESNLTEDGLEILGWEKNIKTLKEN